MSLVAEIRVNDLKTIEDLHLIMLIGVLDQTEISLIAKLKEVLEDLPETSTSSASTSASQNRASGKWTVDAQDT